MKTSSSLAFALVALVIGGCAASTSNASSDNADSSSDELRAASVLASTFTVKNDANAMPFSAITMKSDHTFKATGGCPMDGTGAHCHAITQITGNWKTVKSGPQLGSPQGAPQLQLTDTFDQVTTYFYSMNSDELVLTTSFNSQKVSTFDRDVSKLPKLESFDRCADKFDNSLGICPEDLPCNFDGPGANAVERCLPPI